ncbi:MAG: dihydropteroate synthase [Planctomycetaceae bacterium]|nr:dihydropteroate synthase [Planctomycetaceae bacterium]
MPRYLFITGRLAEHALRSVVETLAPAAGFEAQIAVLPITVAALLQVDWILKKLTLPAGIDRVILPGWSLGDTRLLERHFGVPFERGPKNLYDLPEHFGRARRPPPDLSKYDVEILAEINHVPRLSDVQILETAEGYRRDGADIIDLGCIPGEPWTRVREVVTMLRGEGFRLSIDSFERSEVDAAVEAGAELVLSCNSSNIDWAAGLGVELVAIPDDPHRLDTLEPVIERLTAVGARFRIDPILEPIGFGFAASLARYSEARRRWPDLPIMMGIGNVTELSEADTGGMNLLLAGLCQELGIRSVLATQVINWARTAVKEFDLARRLVFHAVNERVLPKHLSSQLVLLRDARLREMGPEELQRLAESIRDPNFRLFVERGEIHVLNRDGYWHGRDAYELFDHFNADSPGLDASHAFYLGYELSKAVTALTLGKQYTQDEALQWGFLTLPEASAHARRKDES